MYNEETTQKRSIPWVGAVLIIVGLFFILDNLDIIYFNNIFSLWPIILILMGANKIINNEDKTFAIVLVVAGVVFLLNNVVEQFDYYFSDYFWPFIFILGGVYLIFKRNTLNVNSVDLKQGNSRDFLDVNSVFGSTRQNVESKAWLGGQIVTVFGGADIDLRSAEIKDDHAILDVNIVFGGITIFVPDNWNVHNNATPMFGAVEDKRRNRANDATATKTLVIKGIVLFGGVDIK
jgi:predicted membrane protein